MQTIIVEGGDGLSKSTLIEGICKHFEFDNVTVRHLGKPPKNVNVHHVYKWQMRCFIKEGELLKQIADMEVGDHKYYENIVIYNRSYLGEFTYGVLFREYRKEFIKLKLMEYEKQYIDLVNTKLITLTSDPEFFLGQEDGKSLSQTLEQKTAELELFKEAHEFSTIADHNKLLLKVDRNGAFLSKEELLKTVIDFITE